MSIGRPATRPGSLFAADDSVESYRAELLRDAAMGSAVPVGRTAPDRTGLPGVGPANVVSADARSDSTGSDAADAGTAASDTVELRTVPPRPAAPRPAGSKDAFAALRSLSSPRRGDGVPGDAGSVPDQRTPTAADPSPRVSPAAVVTFLLFAVVTVVAHVGAAWLAAARVATAGEAHLAVAALATRSQTGSVGPLSLTDRFATVQIAVVQLLLPAGDPVDTARWACLGVGAVTMLLLWPVLRRLELPLPAVAVAVAVVGLTLPVLVLRAGVSAAAPAALWLTVAAALATRDRWRTALLFAVLAVATAPLTAVVLLGLAAHLVLSGAVRTPARPAVGGLLGLATVVVAVLGAGSGPLAGMGGPDVPTALAVAGATVALLLVVIAAATAEWLRPALTGTVPLLAVLLVPGPSRVTAALLVLPLLAVAVAVLVEQVRSWGRWPLAALVAAVLLLIAVPLPAAVARAGGAPPSASLAEWIATQTGPDTVVVADPLDRAALLGAGVPAGRLRTPDDPVVPAELRMVSDRPGGSAVACPASLVLAATPRGAGGAPGVVCGTDAASLSAGAIPARARFGGALADNPGLDLSSSASAELRAGEVDPRLLLTLAALTGAHQIGITDFPAVPLDDPSVPRRQVVIARFDGGPASVSTLLHTWLNAQQSPFAPSTIRQDGASLVISYPLPAPVGLLPS